MNNNYILKDGVLIHADMYEDYLMHFGVPGMKWGFRKSNVHRMDKQAKKDLKFAKSKRKNKDIDAVIYAKKRAQKRAARSFIGNTIADALLTTEAQRQANKGNTALGMGLAGAGAALGVRGIVNGVKASRSAAALAREENRMRKIKHNDYVLKDCVLIHADDYFKYY